MRKTLALLFVGKIILKYLECKVDTIAPCDDTEYINELCQSS